MSVPRRPVGNHCTPPARRLPIAAQIVTPNPDRSGCAAGAYRRVGPAAAERCRRRGRPNVRPDRQPDRERSARPHRALPAPAACSMPIISPSRHRCERGQPLSTERSAPWDRSIVAPALCPRSVRLEGDLRSTRSRLMGCPGQSPASSSSGSFNGQWKRTQPPELHVGP